MAEERQGNLISPQKPSSRDRGVLDLKVSISNFNANFDELVIIGKLKECKFEKARNSMKGSRLSLI